MKRVALALSLALVAPSLASAQVGFGVAAGAALPIGDFGNIYDSGYHAQASLNVAIPLAPIGFRFDGSLDHFDVKSSSSFSGSQRIAGASANVLLGFSAVPLVGPYLIGGVGYYDLHTDLKIGSAASTSSSERKVGGNIGAGVRFGLGTLGVFAEAQYRYISASGTNATFVPLMFGVSF